MGRTYGPSNARQSTKGVETMNEEPSKAQEIADAAAEDIAKDKEEAIQKRIHVKTDMTLEQFYNEMKRLNMEGQAAVQHHKEKIPPPKTEDGVTKAKGHRYHEPGSRIECAFCKPVIKAYEDMQMLQAEQIGMTGIPLDGLFSAIKITRATIKMMKNGGEI